MFKNKLLKCFLIVLISFVVGSTIHYFLPYNFDKTHLTLIPYTGLLMFIELSCVFNETSERFFFASVCGLYYAIAYSNGLVIYVLIYCIIVFIRTYLYKLDVFSYLEFIIFSLLTIFANEVVVYSLMVITKSTHLGVISFILLRLLPTLLLNVVIASIVHLVYQKLDIEVDTNEYVPKVH